MRDVRPRALGPGDVQHVKWALYEAVSWDPERELPPFEDTIEHPQLAIYHRGWGRPGDVGVAVELDGDVAGVAFFRLFREGEHGHGFVDEDTPELGIAVREEFRLHRASLSTPYLLPLQQDRRAPLPAQAQLARCSLKWEEES